MEFQKIVKLLDTTCDDRDLSISTEKLELKPQF